MKRLIVCPKCDGGICHYSYCLADSLSELGEEVRVLNAMRPEYELAALPHRHAVRPLLATYGSGWRRYALHVRNLRTLIRESRGAATIHYQWPLGPAADRLHWSVLKRLGRRIVYTAHNAAPHESDNRSERHTPFLFRQADSIITHGRALADEIERTPGVKADRIRVVPHGNYNFVADRFGKWDRESSRESFHWTPDVRSVLFFGFIRPYKGVDILIRAFGQLCRMTGSRSQRYRLLIAGADPFDVWTSGEYGDLLERAGILERTSLVREYIALEDAGRFFHASDVVALPYRSGSQSGALMLANAFIRPVVATRVGSIGESVEMQGSGILVQPEDVEALAGALEQLLEDRALADRLGRNGRDYADTELSWSRIAEQTLEAYALAAGSRGRRG